MKKFYFFLCAMMVAIAANATDYYLIGGFNGWTLAQENCKFTDQGDGTYVLDYQGTLTSGFKLNDGTWSNPDANFGGSATLVLGEKYSLVLNGGNIPLSENIENPHIVLNPSEPSITITGQSVEATYVYGIHGQIFGDSNWSTTNMTEENGKWVISGEMVAGSFGIKEMDAMTFTQTNWISAANAEDSEIVLDKVIPMQVEGTNLYLSAPGTYTFTFDPEAMTLVVTGESVIVDPVMALGIHGNIFDGEWKTYTMTQDQTIFTLTAQVMPGEFGIKLFDLNTNEQLGWFAAMNEELANVVLDEPLYITDFNPVNFVLATGGELTFTVDIDAMLLTITDKSGIADVEIDNVAPVYYNLNGVKVDAPKAGLYIEVRGTVARKVTIK